MTNCVTCNKPIVNLLMGRPRKFCNTRCEKRFRSIERRELNPPSNLPNATTGAISELKVSIDLLSKGYNVFRALSPSCPCDLAILMDGELLKVEVTTGRYTVGGKATYAAHDETKFDILAVVLPDSIMYYPSLI